MVLLAYLLLTASGLWLVAVSVFMFGWPRSALVGLGKMASTNFINYTEITLRMIAGWAFLAYADHSYYPKVLMGCGWVLVVTAGMLYLIPRRWHAAYAVFWSERLTPTLVRLAALLSFAAGVLLIVVIQ